LIQKIETGRKKRGGGRLCEMSLLILKMQRLWKLFPGRV